MRLFAAGVRTRSRVAKRCGAPQRGVALVEQALMLPILAALFFGIVDMGRALYSYTYVSYIARDATRWASVRSAGSMNGSSLNQVQGYVSNVSGMGLDPARVTSTTKYVAPANATPLCPGGVAGSNANNKPGCIVEVTVNYNFKFFLLSTNPLLMSSESQMTITQ
jgi:Flp pilus assembly protein TadG